MLKTLAREQTKTVIARKLKRSVAAAARLAVGAECGTEEHNKHRAIAFEKVAEIHRVSDRILLLSSGTVETPFRVLTNFVQSELVFTLVDCPKAATNYRKELDEKLSEAWAFFIKSARDDLGIHPRVLETRCTE
jgi:hypothetical protein